MDKIWFILPLYNETEIINTLYEKLITTIKKINCDYELLFIDDKWKNSPLEKLTKLHQQDPKVRFIEFTRNFWHESAVKAGMDNISDDCNYVLMMDCDLQDPPELVEHMYNKIKEWYDLVYAKKSKRSKKDWLFNNTSTFAFYRILNKMTNLYIPEDTWNFRIYTKQVNDVVRMLNEQSRFLRWLFAWVWYKQTYVEFKRGDRAQGETWYGFWKYLSFALDGIFSFSDKPLKVATWFGFIFSLIWFFAGLFFVIIRFIDPNRYVSGITTIIVLLFIIGWIQLIILWVIWEYIGRIYKETKNRPLYIIKKKYE